jgi:hypothetical protein
VRAYGVCVVRCHLYGVEWINVWQGMASGGVIMGGVKVGGVYVAVGTWVPSVVEATVHKDHC